MSAPSGSITPASAELCRGGVQLLTATGGTSYQWKRNGEVISGATASTYQARQGGTYTVTLINGSCSAEAANEAIVREVSAPSLLINTPAAICNGSTINLKDNSITSGSDANLTFTYWKDANATIELNEPESASAGTYYIKATNALGCFTIKTVVITVAAVINATITPANPLVSCNGEPVVLTANNGSGYKWYKDDVLIQSAATAVLSVNEPGVYHVMVGNGTCDGGPSNKVEVKFQECMPVAETKVVVPTAFSPNNNNANDQLRPLLYNIDQLKYFKVFNRWGQLVFQTQTLGAGWDGKINGQLQPTETYTWIVECVDRDGKIIRQSGRTILIR